MNLSFLTKHKKMRSDCNIRFEMQKAAQLITFCHAEKTYFIEKTCDEHIFISIFQEYNVKLFQHRTYLKRYYNTT